MDEGIELKVDQSEEGANASLLGGTHSTISPFSPQEQVHPQTFGMTCFLSTFVIPNFLLIVILFLHMSTPSIPHASLPSVSVATSIKSRDGKSGVVPPVEAKNMTSATHPLSSSPHSTVFPSVYPTAYPLLSRLISPYPTSTTTITTASAAVANATPPAATNATLPAATNATLPAATNATPPAVTNAAPPAATSATPPAVTNATLPAATNATPPAATNATPPAATNAAPPAATVTVESRPHGTSSEIVSNYLHNNSLPLLANISRGVYKDKVKMQKFGLEKTIVVTATNYGFLNLFHNFNCYMEKLGFKYLTIALELHTHYYLNRHGFVSYYLDHDEHSTLKDGGADEHAAGFDSKSFNSMTYKKCKAVYELLELGYNIIFSDTDVVFLHDPVPYLLFQNVDYIHSHNVHCQNGSLYEPTSDHFP